MLAELFYVAVEDKAGHAQKAKMASHRFSFRTVAIVMCVAQSGSVQGEHFLMNCHDTRKSVT